MPDPPEPEILLSERHPISGRWAVVEDDGRSGWLYLTETNRMRSGGGGVFFFFF